MVATAIPFIGFGEGAPLGLDRLAIGTRARVEGVTGQADVRRRLLEMGLCTGVEVEVLRRAPFGGPVELRVRGYLLSLRADQARLVHVAALQ